MIYYIFMNDAIKIVLVFITLIIFSCKEKEEYPVVPEITYKSYQAYAFIDTVLDNKTVKGELVFSFVDGDGDIGSYYDGEVVETADSGEYDLYIQKYTLQNNVFNAVEEPLKYYLPYFEPEEKNSFLKGDVTVTFNYFNLKADTFYYEFFIYDRKKNKSNIELTKTFDLIPDSIY